MVRQRESWLAALIICLSFFMIVLDTTIALVALPAIPGGLGTSPDAALWEVNAYLLVYAVLLITTGRLNDVLGQRPMFAAGLVVFTIASALCGLPADAGQLIEARALQGLGGVMMAPQSLAMLTVLFPRECLNAALGHWSAVVGFSRYAGPTAGPGARRPQ
jgi:MFS family permease